MSANPHANGGLLMRDLDLPNIADYAVKVDQPGKHDAEATAVMGAFLRDVLKASAERRNFRVFGPDETASNRLQKVFEVTNRAWDAETLSYDDHLAPDGPGDGNPLSEHTCQGWLEGYLLTGRHGFFSCYEAFIHIIDSMFNQHAKWLKTTSEIALAPAHRLAQLSAHLPCLAPGPQRLQPSGSGFHRLCRATRSPRSSGSICRRTPIPCSS